MSHPTQDDDQWREGPPVRYVPVCVLRNLGFIGGPIGWEQSETERSPIVIDVRDVANE